MAPIDNAGKSPSETPKKRIRYVPVVGPRLKKLLFVVFGLFALLVVNSVYLVSVTAAQYASGNTIENYFYQYMFLVHLILGLSIILPVVIFGITHIKNPRNRPNKRAIRAGYALFAMALLVLITGLVLMRVDLGALRLDIKTPAVRSTAYWLHVIGPLGAMWLFILHRLAGRRIKWKTGLSWAAVAGVFAVVTLAFHSQDPRLWNVAGNPSGEQYFFPGLSRTVSGDFIPANVLRNDQYCKDCHEDVHESWSYGVHRFSSFNNPAYVFSVRASRRAFESLQFACKDPVHTQQQAIDADGRIGLRPRRRPDGPGGHHVHGLPQHHPRRQHHARRHDPRQRRLHDR